MKDPPGGVLVSSALAGVLYRALLLVIQLVLRQPAVPLVVLWRPYEVMEAVSRLLPLPIVLRGGLMLSLVLLRQIVLVVRGCAELKVGRHQLLARELPLWTSERGIDREVFLGYTARAKKKAETPFFDIFL